MISAVPEKEEEASSDRMARVYLTGVGLHMVERRGSGLSPVFERRNRPELKRTMVAEDKGVVRGPQTQRHRPNKRETNRTRFLLDGYFLCDAGASRQDTSLEGWSESLGCLPAKQIPSDPHQMEKVRPE